jgi:spermidine synthase
VLSVSSPAQRLVSAAFFLSGASGLIFEVVWFHRCGLVLGNTIWASSVVLSSFMSGLAIGSVLAARLADRIRDFLRTYAALEIVVAVTGLGLTVALPGFSTLLKPIMRAGLETSWLVNLVRIVTAFCALVVPSTAMGATLPVLTAAVCRLQPGFGRALGRLYGWNAIGAVAGVIGAETLLVPRLGVVGSAMIAALLNLVAATVAFAVWKLTTTGSNPVARTPTLQGVRSRTAWRPLVCAALAGAGLMALEVIWFRMLSMFVVNTTLAMSLMLAAVLTAIGLGGLVGSWWIGRTAAAEQFVPATGFAIACVVMVSYESFRFATGDQRPSEWYRIMSFALWLTFPAALLSGVIFTLLGQVLRPLASSDLTTASRLVLANTVGATTGPILTAFVLLPWFGMERSLVGLAVVYCLIGLLMLGTAKRGRR